MAREDRNCINSIMVGAKHILKFKTEYVIISMSPFPVMNQLKKGVSIFYGFFISVYN